MVLSERLQTICELPFLNQSKTIKMVTGIDTRLDAQSEAWGE